jgi:hypothetical protein
VVVKSAPALSLALKDAYMRSVRVTNVKDLAGFPKGYRPPQWSNDTGNGYIQKYAEADIQEEIDEVYNKAREYFSLRSRDMKSSTNREGGSVQTPHFLYEINVRQSKTNPANAIFQRILYLWAAKDQLDTGFNNIFPVMPDDIVIPIIGNLDYDRLVEQFEDFEEAHGGKLTLRNSDEILIYESVDGLELEVDVNEGILTASSGMGYSVLALVDRVSKGLQQLTGKSMPLLPDSEEE